MVNSNQSSLWDKPAKPEHGLLKPARTIPEKVDLGVSFAKKILTLRWPVTDLDAFCRCARANGQAKGGQLYRTSRLVQP